jgi:glutaredoxin 3
MKFDIYTKPHCPYCVRAKRLFDTEGDAYTEIEIGKDIDRDAFLEILPNARTVPQIFLITEEKRIHIGGYTDLEKWHVGGRNEL